MLNAPTKTEWHVTAWQQGNNVGACICDTEEEAVVWMRKWQAEGWTVKIRRIVKVVQ